MGSVDTGSLEILGAAPGGLDDGRGELTLLRRGDERLDRLFEAQCDRLRAAGHGDRAAVDAEGGVLTYDELDAGANQLARHLSRRGVGAGDRVGLLFDTAVHAYTGMLAVLKLNAAYVPLDVGFPADRVAYIVSDAGVSVVLTQSHLQPSLAKVAADVLFLDDLGPAIECENSERLSDAERGAPVDQLCYVVYTSGSTGRPKGVAVEHASICNFVQVAAQVYGVTGQDRVYQGMTIAFDFSVEEIWVPWMVGATLVPRPRGGALVGVELREFLIERQISALCCVPTLLATIEDDVPGLRFLLVSGEACPQDLIARWYRPDRRFLNVYGPTETTVTATWTSLHPDRRVTIGVPLPTYSVVILEPDAVREVPPGAVGEIGIAGIGLAAGYLNRPDLTERAFVPDVLGLPDNPSGRIYRTGDLGRYDDDGQIEYLGRIDTQVKIRGYRIELTEIESVLLQLPGIAAAVVEPYRPEPDVVELVAYFSRRRDAVAVDPAELQRQLRDRLPSYMVPAYLEELDALPMLPSDKVDRKSLPAPRGGRRVTGHGPQVEPRGDTEQVLAQVLADVLGVPRVSVRAHFFGDLGADSLRMARYCARVRQHPGLAGLAMQDVYQHPTVEQLGALLDAQARGRQPEVASSGWPGDLGPPRARTVGGLGCLLCGVAQTAVFAGYAYLVAWGAVAAFGWLSTTTDLAQGYLRAVALVGGLLAGMLVIPIAAKWALIGRWTPRDIPIWSATYLRFWTVRTLIRMSPAALFVGSPLYVLYLRALGAKIGPRVLILSRNVPVCTDLVTIGAGSVIRKDAFLNGYRAEAGTIRTGRITVGRDAFIGEATILDIDTGVGNGAQLGHSSALLRGQHVPDGRRWHGSPAQPTSVDHVRVPPMPYRRFRATSYAVGQLLTRLLIVGPLALGLGDVVIFRLFPGAQAALLGPDVIRTGSFYQFELAITTVLVLGGLLIGLAVVTTVPRALALLVRPGRTYPIYGLQYSVQRTIARMTNLRLFTTLFGDSSFIVGYLSRLGYRLRPLEQTGSNFGLAIKHEDPYLISVGTGTMISDGLSMMNAEFSGTSFRVCPVDIGQRGFVGNNIAYPAGARVGDNCLLATKVLVPLDGHLRADVGLLGSPPFEIPRSVQRDTQFDHLRTGVKMRRRLAAKNRHNAATIGLFLLVRWVYVLLLGVLLTAAADLQPTLGTWVVALAVFLIPVLSAAYFIPVERATLRFRALQPQFCSIYDRRFWRHERFWKLSTGAYLQFFNGTPMKSWIWRALGVRVGRRLFDDGCGIPEKTLVSIGNDCTLNQAAVLQGHSLEDGTFKSDRITLGDGCTVGTGAFVHYGVRLHAGAVLEADSFLMKGEQIPEAGRWQGNPARPSGTDLPSTERILTSAAASHPPRPGGRIRTGRMAHARRKGSVTFTDALF